MASLLFFLIVGLVLTTAFIIGKKILKYVFNYVKWQDRLFHQVLEDARQYNESLLANGKQENRPDADFSRSVPMTKTWRVMLMDANRKTTKKEQEYYTRQK